MCVAVFADTISLNHATLQMETQKIDEEVPKQSTGCPRLRALNTCKPISVVYICEAPGRLIQVVVRMYVVAQETEQLSVYLRNAQQPYDVYSLPVEYSTCDPGQEHFLRTNYFLGAAPLFVYGLMSQLMKEQQYSNL